MKLDESKIKFVEYSKKVTQHQLGLPMEQLSNYLKTLSPHELRFIIQQAKQELRCDFFSRLPPEISSLIISFLDLEHILRLEQVSRYVHELVQRNIQLWYRLSEFERRKGLRDLSEMDVSAFKLMCKQNEQTRSNWKTGNSTTLNFQAHGSFVITCLITTEDYILTASDDATVKLWTAKNGLLKRTLLGHQGGVWALDCNTQYIVSGSTDRSLKIWNYDGVCLNDLVGHTSTVRCLKIVNQFIVSGSRDHTLRIWNFDGRCLHTLQGHTESVRCLDIIPSKEPLETAIGTLVVSGSYDADLRIWSLQTAECIQILQGHTSKIYSVVCQNDLIASGSQDATVRLWDLDGICLSILEGHRSLVGELAFHRNFLISSSTDSQLRIWNTRSALCVDRIHASSSISCFAVDADRIVWGSDRFVRMYCWKTKKVYTLLENVDVVWKCRFDFDSLVVACQENGIASLKIIKFRGTW